MLKYFAITGMLLLAIACTNKTETTETTEPETSEESPTGFFGEKITEEGAIEASELLTMLKEGDSVFVKVRGTINECCQKKGCWMDVDLGNGKTMVVRFKDYEFFVPKNSAGYTAIMEGYAKLEVQDVEWLRHKAQDAGKSAEEIAAITQPDTSITFMANGVIIK
ncbi:hypothetical protein JCM31826_03000 [Thermaurantimonas aggregans]|uniref:DUF4920 domain-containing protein n=2 Tax=Thermaurantimonas aggregans TaxID=2173829 RepID=A0A401XIK0_9FLAO|nr:DUF4920 domain-containing protein [Thermaurantimonas aggregans]GCD76818.1 hypothetical protein JCM31826_03000 [Thermaurantimonas aggregans]